MKYALTLPWPPSVNHYWQRNQFGGVRVGAKGLKFRAETCLVAEDQVRKIGTITEPVAVSIVACQPNRIRRDLDNLLKATLDSLSHANVYADDSLVHSLTLKWGENVKGGKLEVTVKTI